MHTDFADLLKIFNAHKVQYLLVGAYAVMFHSEPRYTKDMDVWVNPVPENAVKVFAALAAFGAPLKGIHAADFISPGTIYQIGVEPVRIDILTRIPGLRFDAAWKNRSKKRIEGLICGYLSLGDTLKAKRASGRPQDLEDIKRIQITQKLQKKKLARK